jgi:hypothetical protein
MRRPVSVNSAFFLPWILTFEPSRLCRHPSISTLEQFSLGAWWAFPIQANCGFVVVGTSRETGAFAVDAVVERMRQDLLSAKGQIVDASRLWRGQQRPGARMEIPLAAATL